jgi:phosphoglycolate phosphatase
MKYKLVIFDFDGTLADSFPWALSVIDSVADKYRVKRLEQEQIEILRSYHPRTLMKMYGIPMWKMPIISRHVHKRMAKEIHAIPLFEGVDRLFDTLASQGTRLAVVSSNAGGNVKAVLGPHIVSMIEYFECGVSLFGKPAKLRKVLKKSGVRPEDAICIGDEIRDIEAAHKVKIPFGAVAWGYSTVEALRALFPAEVFTSMDDMIDKIT